jgi:Putative transposase of IS4/5 family (DUF4096)
MAEAVRSKLLGEVHRELQRQAVGFRHVPSRTAEKSRSEFTRLVDHFCAIVRHLSEKTPTAGWIGRESGKICPEIRAELRYLVTLACGQVTGGVWRAPGWLVNWPARFLPSQEPMPEVLPLVDVAGSEGVCEAIEKYVAERLVGPRSDLDEPESERNEGHRYQARNTPPNRGQRQQESALLSVTGARRKTTGEEGKEIPPVRPLAFWHERGHVSFNVAARDIFRKDRKTIHNWCDKEQLTRTSDRKGIITTDDKFVRKWNATNQPENFADLTDNQWASIEPLFHTSTQQYKPPTNVRAILNAVLFVQRTGRPWRSLPKRYPPVKTCHRWYQRWCREGLLKKINDRLRLIGHSPPKRKN